jgi:hypothetical protein
MKKHHGSQHPMSLMHLMPSLTSVVLTVRLAHADPRDEDILVKQSYLCVWTNELGYMGVDP